MTPCVVICSVVLTAALCLVPSGGLVRDGVARQMQITVPSTAEIERGLLEALNAARAARNVPAVRALPELTELARAHSADMARRDVLSHESESGASFSQRLISAGLTFVMNGENVGRGNTFLARLIHQSFMDSPPHRDNILNPAFDAIGIGVAIGRRGMYFVTEDFIRSLTPAARADVRAMMLGALNEARAKARLGPVVLSDDLNRTARELVEAKADGRDVPGLPAGATRTSTRFITGPDLDQLAASIREQEVAGFGQGGIGSVFIRSREYPAGAYIVCILLIWDGS
ncbi:MAG: CAP domain-containing protein [Acidobacteria bacterium]|nr:CAP domain-containing protein [Acidobacteriota bacterium]